MRWRISSRFDPEVLPLADRHYSRQKPGTSQFVPPGSCVVLKTDQAAWVTSWPKEEYVRHEWAGAWMNSFFRNEGPHLSSELVREAVAATQAFYGAPPDLGMVTFIDTEKVRRKRDPGRCYRKAGFKVAGTTKGGLLALQLLPDEMPEPCAALTDQLEFDLGNPVEAPREARSADLRGEKTLSGVGAPQSKVAA